MILYQGLSCKKKNQMHIKKKKTPISERFEKPQLLLKDSHVF